MILLGVGLALALELLHIDAPGASLREALLAIAALGGHIKNNGDPGWLVLSRG